MPSTTVPRQVLDFVVSRRLFTACWLGASLGLSMLQLRLLAQAWQQSPHALVPACFMSLWTLGSLIGVRLSTPSRLWGGATIVGTLFWFMGPSVVTWHLPRVGVPIAWMSLVTLALLAVLLGASSSAWLTQQRPWPAPGERTVLVRGLMGLTVGLVVAWMLPAWSALLTLACCLPLFLLDVCFSGRAPLPNRGGIAADWVQRWWQVERPLLQLEQRVQPWSWSWNWLVERSHSSRGYLWLTLLASGVAVLLGSIWGAVPTPFAAGLLATHTLEKLGWLLGGQLAVVTLGAYLLLFVAREVIGFPERVVPTSWQAHARLLITVVPVGMAAALVALGLPLLQAPWWLAASLAGYTSAGAVWGLLLPRLRPSVSTQMQSHRHLLLKQGMAGPSVLHHAYSSAQEAQVMRRLARTEGLLIALLTPLLGWLIDIRGNVDPLLVSVGLAFLVVLLVGAAVTALVPKLRRARTSHRAILEGTRHTAHVPSFGLTRPAW